MSEHSAIQWTDASWNPITGCSRKSDGCSNCYAELLTGTRLRHQPKYVGLARITTNGPRFTGETRFHEDELLKPLKWRKPRKIFVCSMSDLFHENNPFDWIDKIFAVMALCPQHTFQVLTKRPERMAEYLRDERRADIVWEAMVEATWEDERLTEKDAIAFKLPLPNVWLGTSCENQEAADLRIPHLLQCPAAVRFLSCEPLLGEISLCFDDRTTWLDGLHWVIVGGESGRNARPCVIGHIRSLVKQCKAADVKCFVKQLGARVVEPEEEWRAKRSTHMLSGRDHLNNPKGYVRLKFAHSHGGDIREFPLDLRIREFPQREGLEKAGQGVMI